MDVIKLLADLIRIDTRNPPGYTTEAVEYLKRLFASFNTKVVGKEGKENLIVEISRGKPEFLFTSHLDTVPCEDELLNPVVRDGKIYGRGSCDAKGCVASIVSAFYEFECDVGVKLAFTSDEEVGGKLGLGEVMKHISPDYVIIGEPFGSDRIGVAQAHVVTAKIIVLGESGHTATADVRRGAVYRASKFVIDTVRKFSKIDGKSDYLRKLEELGFETEYRGNGSAVFNPSIIRGGVKRNVVPDRCEIEADIRIAPWISPESLKELFDYDYVEVNVTGYLRAFGFSLDAVDERRDLELLNMIKRAIEMEGGKPKAVVSLGVGDARHVRCRGIPAFYLGPRGENLHGRNEFVYIDDIFRISKIYRNIVTVGNRHAYI